MADLFGAASVETGSPPGAETAADAPAHMESDSYETSQPDASDAVLLDASSPSPNDVLTTEKTDSPIEEFSKPDAPLLELAGGQILFLLRDYAKRLSGSEGKALVAVVDEQDSNRKGSPMVKLWGSSRKITIGFDSISHALLP